jgi:hypothetical protein
MNSVIIGSSGQISIPTITAASGSAKDIQVAVDWVVAHGGIGNVYIPEGTFNFVEVGESWTGARVVIPAGVNLFGAPTERTNGLPYDGIGMNPNDQVVEWKTILRLPWDVPGSWQGGTGNPPRNGAPISPFWFKITGSGDPNKPSRFSDIKLEGYRVIDPDSKMILKALYIENVVDFRVDHVYFEGVAGGGVTTFGVSTRGVIDHSFFVNHEGYVVADYADNTVGYGVQIDRAYGDYWEDDVSKVLGKYTNYTTFIEDSYFEKWRHVTASANGAHYVIRHSTIKDDFGYGSIDSHGRGYTENGVYKQVGTRATEVYNNTIINAVRYPYGTATRGGAGIAFNNTVGGGTYTMFFYMYNEAPEDASKLWIKDWWIWNNTMLAGCRLIVKYEEPGREIIEGRDYFLHVPHTFTYEPYPYPHPLTLKEIP